jgi:hypothetical protein
MLSIRMNTFTDVRKTLVERILEAPQVKTEKWQGISVVDNPAAVSYELRNVCFECPLLGVEDLAHWREDTGANIPWADDHFLERVSGLPLNPGTQWANWPWASSADKFRARTEGEAAAFNHTYMQRLWPKWAGHFGDSSYNQALPMTNGSRRQPSRQDWYGNPPRRGVYQSYGDLQDLIELLVKEPFTRQAWIPLFFPEDTGIGDGGRKPCTLGYQIMVRMNGTTPQAHIWYPLRSCDLVRHFPDDCYLAVRLLLWIIWECRKRDPKFWDTVEPGSYAMHVTSLHIFENDKRTLGGK